MLREFAEFVADTDIDLGPEVQTAKTATPAVDILALATATPEFKMTQKEAFERVKRIAPHLARLEGIYTSSALETRHA